MGRIHALEICNEIERRIQETGKPTRAEPNADKSEESADELKRAGEKCAEKLQEANAELSQYAYVVSHDLKAPLRAIRNYSDFLQEDLSDSLNNEQKMYLEGLTKAVDLAENLIDDLLRLSKIGNCEPEYEKTNCRAIIQDICTYIDIPSDAKIIIQQDIPVIRSEPLLFRQIFQNLITNGIKFNESSMKIVEITYEEKENNHIFHIKDNGIGINGEYLPQIFQPFKRLHTKQEYEGTGIGLAIVKKALNRLQGSVDIESNPGKGSTFSIILPKTAAEDKDG